LEPKDIVPDCSNPRILVIDDLEEAHTLFRSILTAEPATEAPASNSLPAPGHPAPVSHRVKFIVDSAYGAKDSLELLQRGLAERRRYAVAFIDIWLHPGANGIETTLALWKADPELQVVIYTSDAHYSWDDLAAQLGHKDNLVVLKKPFEPLEVLQLAHALTRKWALIQTTNLYLEHLEVLVRERTHELVAANQQCVRAEHALQHRLDREKLISTLSTNFINLAPSEVDAALKNALKSMGEFTQADGAYIFQAAPDHRTLDNTHEWCAPGIQPIGRPLKNIAVPLFSWLMENLRRFEPVYIPKVSALPGEARAEKNLLQAVGLQSFVAVPLACENTLMGFLGFSSARTETVWQEEDIALMRTASEILANALQHKRAAARILRLNRLYSVLSRINELIIRTRSPELLCQEACRIAVEEGSFRMAWVCMVDPATRAVKPVAHWGLEAASLASVRLSAADNVPEGLGPTGTAIREEKYALVNDVDSEPRMAPWRLLIAQHRYRSAAAFPLKVRGRVVGAFTFFDSAPHFFDDEEIRLLDQVSAALAFALELVELAQHLHQLFTHTPMGCITWDSQHRVTSWNPAAQNIFGYSEPEVLGKQPHEFLLPERVRELVDGIGKRLLQGEVDAHTINENLTKDGRTILCRWTSAPLRSANGSVVGVLSMVQDVTERRQLEEQLRQAQKMEAVGQLAGGIAHDFNNLLFVMRGNTELVLMNARKLPARSLEHLKQVVAAAERAGNLTRQLLAFSRKQVMRIQPLNLNERLANLTEMLRGLVGENIELQCEYLTPSAWTRADPGMLEQVIVNLVVNSRDAMPKGGLLRLATDLIEFDATYALAHPEARAGEFVCLSISDTGTGIAPQDLPRIFEPFFTTKDVGKGTGLGLATVYGIVKQHQGWLDVASELGKGIGFNIFLPAVAAPIQAAPAAPIVPEPPLRGGNERILLVEDDYAVRIMLHRVLENYGYRVWEAASGRKALEVWREHGAEVDLLLSDVVMPEGLNGHDLAEQLQAQQPDLKIILMSGYGADKAVKQNEFFSRTRSTFVQKPASFRTLLQAVRRRFDEP
jgi:PAS domain S-box-containing protein